MSKINPPIFRRAAGGRLRSRGAREQLYRYLRRLALANERVQRTVAGQVLLRMKTPWHNGTTHRVMPPLAFLQKLAVLMPRPHLTRLHGVVASNATLRAGGATRAGRACTTRRARDYLKPVNLA